MATFNWDELDVQFDIKPLESKATRKGLIAWEQIQNVISTIFPVPIHQGAVQTEGVGIALPGFQYLRADSIHFQPQTPRVTNTDVSYNFDALNTYENAECTITYITPKYTLVGLEGQNGQAINPDPVKYLEHRWTIGAEFLTVPPTTELTWWNGGVPATADPVSDEVVIGKRIPTIEHQLSWPYVLYPPFAAMRSCIGKTNSAQITFQTGVIAPGTLLFVGAELQRQVLSNGTRAWNVSYRFSEKNIRSDDGTVQGWNVLWNPVSAVFDSLSNGGTINTFPYELTDFSGLFQVAQSG